LSPGFFSHEIHCLHFSSNFSTVANSAIRPKNVIATVTKSKGGHPRANFTGVETREIAESDFEEGLVSPKYLEVVFERKHAKYRSILRHGLSLEFYLPDTLTMGLIEKSSWFCSVLFLFTLLGCAQSSQTSKNTASNVEMSILYTCNPDINQWGYSSSCQCPAQQSYNPMSGQCGEAAPVSPGPLCTTDVNSWGHPGNCDCPSSYKYDGQTLMCYPSK